MQPPTMNRTLLPLMFAGVLVAALQGCATNDSVVTPAQTVSGFQQLDKGANQTFVGCSPCAKPTEKSLWTAPEQEPRVNANTLPSQGPRLEGGGSTTANNTTSPTGQMRNQSKGVVIQFDLNKATLSAGAKQQLNTFCETAKDGESIQIIGRTDATGTEHINQKLAQARAQATEKYLNRCLKGKGKKAITTMSAQGQCCYVADNKSEEGRARNRRSEVVAAPENRVSDNNMSNNRSTGNEGNRP